MNTDNNKCPICGSNIAFEGYCANIHCSWTVYGVDVWTDDNSDDGWTDDQEEDLIRAGICPECGAELDVCPHGADWFDDDLDILGEDE